jgi:hypothetical protein
VVSSPAAMNQVVVELGVLGGRLRTGPVGGHVLSFFVITSLLLIGGRRNHVGGGSLRRRPRLFDTTDGTSVGRLIRPRMSDLRRCLLRGRRHQRSSGRGRARTDQVRDQPSPAGLMRGTEGALRSADSRGARSDPAITKEPCHGCSGRTWMQSFALASTGQACSTESMPTSGSTGSTPSPRPPMAKIHMPRRAACSRLVGSRGLRARRALQRLS